jgi:hypothetical protein
MESISKSRPLLEPADEQEVAAVVLLGPSLLMSDVIRKELLLLERECCCLLRPESSDTTHTSLMGELAPPEWIIPDNPSTVLVVVS